MGAGWEGKDGFSGLVAVFWLPVFGCQIAFDQEVGGAAFSRPSPQNREKWEINEIF
jgi:hypothetical protein